MPDGVSLYTQEYYGGLWKWCYYCFPHAVLRALEGEKIKMKLTTDDYEIHRCADCRNSGDPQSHELGSLRKK